LKTGVQSYFIQYWYEETNAILNLQPQYQEIAKYTRGHCSSSLPFHLARAFDLKSPAL